MTKDIQLTQGKVSVVDDEDFEELNQYKWYTQKGRKTFYAARHGLFGKTIYMHQQITGFKLTDHIDGNGLKNTRENLRESTFSQNAMNSKKRENTSSRFKGVCWDKRARNFVVYISINGKRKHIGNFDSEIDAALAYNKYAIELFGEFAQLNLI